MPTNTQLQQQFVARLLRSPPSSDEVSFGGQAADRTSLLSCIAQISVEMGEISASGHAMSAGDHGTRLLIYRTRTRLQDQLVDLIGNNGEALHELLCTSTELADELAGLFEQASTLASPLDGMVSRLLA